MLQKNVTLYLSCPVPLNAPVNSYFHYCCDVRQNQGNNNELYNEITTKLYYKMIYYVVRNKEDNLIQKYEYVIRLTYQTFILDL